MKKIFFLSLIAVMTMVSKSFAQNTLVATLIHDGEISVYYGATALKEAHTAATHGDIITLSAGTFSGTDITKAITLRGAGARGTQVTYVNGVNGIINIGIPDDITEHLTLEGIYFYNSSLYVKKGCILQNAIISKCFMDGFYASGGTSRGTASGCSFINCLMRSEINCAGENNSAIGSIIADVRESASSTTFMNCILTSCNSLGSQAPYISLTNCILVYPYFNMARALSSTSTATNCLAVKNFTESFNAFGSILGAQNYGTVNSGVYTSWYALTEEAAAKYIGTDGTQIGIYGGPMPFNTDITVPHITKCNVASKATADGKLSVDIEVEIPD